MIGVTSSLSERTKMKSGANLAPPVVTSQPFRISNPKRREVHFYYGLMNGWMSE